MLNSVEQSVCRFRAQGVHGTVPFMNLRTLLAASPPDVSSSFSLQRNFMFGNHEFFEKLWDLQECHTKEE